MKRFFAFLIAAVLLLSLAGCANILPHPAEPSPEPTADVSAEPVVTPEPQPSVTPYLPEPPEPDMTAVTFELEDVMNSRSASLHGVLHAYNAEGDEVWTYETEEVYAAQLDNLQALGQVETGYLLCVDGDIICIGCDEDNAGEELWRNSDFGGADCNFDFDMYDNLYICGYFGPDLFVIDKDGNTVAKYDSLVEDYWPCELMYVDYSVEMTFESSYRTYRIDPRSGAAAKKRTNPYFLAENVVEVGTVDELMDALDDDTAIVLRPGVYNVTEWLDDHPEVEYYPVYPQEKTVYRREAFEGDEIIFFGFDDLVIISKYASAPAQIVCEPRHATVMTFVNCEYLGLYDLSCGHTMGEGTCGGNVIDLDDCYMADIRDCDLYGCGAYAMEVTDCYEIWVVGGTVHDCTYGCMISSNSILTCSQVEFTACREFTMFEAWSGSDVTFYGCDFSFLDGNMAYVSQDSSMTFYACMFDAPSLRSLENAECYGELVID